MRKAIGKKLRFDVFKRDGFVCAYCGATPPTVVLQVDHIHPVVLGGTNEIDNLVTSCQPCNIGKGCKTLSAIPQSLEDKAKIILEKEEQITGYQQIIRSKKKRLDSEAWAIVNLFSTEWNPLKKDFSSIRNFIERIGFCEVEEAAEIASEKFSYSLSRAFRYFCGICINKSKEAQQ
jgi:HNH endonuclease